MAMIECHVRDCVNNGVETCWLEEIHIGEYGECCEKMMSNVKRKKVKTMRLIDADAFTRDIQREFEDASSITKMFVNAMIDAIKHAPTIEPEVRHGRWVALEGWFNKGSVKCSVCGNTLDMDGVNAGRGDANFCPNCGADMREEGAVNG